MTSVQRDRGARRPTMNDVASAAGVSRALVSIVFRDAPGASAETRAHVREVAARIGYTMDRRAQLLRRGRTGTIGVIFDVHAAFHGELVEALYATAADRGFSLSLSGVTAGRDEREAVAAAVDERPEGLLLLGTALAEDELAAIGERIPVAAVARAVSGIVDVARTDDREGARLAAAHLLSTGRRSIVYLDGGDAAGAEERREGYRMAMTAVGGTVDVRRGGQDEESGVVAAQALLRSGVLPSGICAFNDRLAIGVREVLLRAGVDVPGEVALAGFDDIRSARLSTIDLTTIAQDSLGIAADALDLVLSRIDAPTRAPREVVRPPRLRVRGTSGTSSAGTGR